MGNVSVLDGESWLRDQFKHERCAECHGDAKDHDAVPFMGNWFARCKRTLDAKGAVDELKKALAALNDCRRYHNRTDDAIEWLESAAVDVVEAFEQEER